MDPPQDPQRTLAYGSENSLPLTPVQLPDYEVLAKLGEGGMGIVYRARQKSLDRTVALKTIAISSLHETVLARFEAEARAVARLRHPNIVTAHDLHRHGGRLYLAMEYLEGETLEQLLERQGRLDETTTWGLIRQAAAGLAHAAAEGLVHRDIKPSNLYLLAPPTGYPLPPGVPLLKVTDFGLALARGVATAPRLTSTGSVVGTPAYMAPEQVRSDEIDARTDIYALGATAFHLLTGRPPFDDGQRSAWEQMMRKTQEEAPPAASLASVTAASSSLVAAMIARDPRARPADYAELLERIDSLTSGRPPAALTRPRLVLKRRHTFLAVALFVCGFVAFGLWWSLRPPQPPPYVAQETVQRLSLFNGETLGPWSVVEGELTRGRDADRGQVLTLRGSARCALPAFAEFAFRIGVDGRSARVAELHFGLPQEATSDGPRHVLRLSEEGAQLGKRKGPNGSFESPLEQLPLSPLNREEDEPAYRDLRIERHTGWWWAFCQDRLVGAVPAHADLERMEVWLVSEGGGILLETPEVAELARPSDPD